MAQDTDLDEFSRLLDEADDLPELDCRTSRRKHHKQSPTAMTRATPRGRNTWNDARTARSIAEGTLAEIRAHECEGALTIAEMDEWIVSYCLSRRIDMGDLTYGAVRAAIKRCEGVRFENRRLLADPMFHTLRWRHAVRRLRTPERAWIFIVDVAPIPAAS